MKPVSHIFLDRKQRKFPFTFFLFFLMFLCILILIGNTFATDSTVDTQKNRKIEKEMSQTQKKTKEEKESKGKKVSTTKQIGTDKTTQDIIRSVKQMIFSEGSYITLPAHTFFYSFIAEKEKEGVTPFSHCLVITNPKIPINFGITAHINENIIDTVKARFLNEAAKTGIPIRVVASEDDIITYRNCMAFYGAVIAQSIINLKNNLTLHSNQNSFKVSNMPHSDFLLLARDAFEKAIYDISDKQVLSLYNDIVNNQDTCFFESSIDKVRCSHTLFTLSTTPKMYSQNVEIFGERFFNYQVLLKLSNSWSYNDALEKLQSSSMYSRFISDVMAYTEELESQGKTKEATLMKKKALDMVLQGKQTVNLSQIKN